jgi:hypothetical protein
MTDEKPPFPPEPATDDDKRRWEVSKLRHEVAELRGWIRRFGGLLGVITAILSVFIAFRSCSESRVSEQLAEVRKERAEIDEIKAKASVKVATSDAAEQMALAQHARQDRKDAEQELHALRQKIDDTNRVAQERARTEQTETAKAAAVQATTASQAVQQLTSASESTKSKSRVFVLAVSDVQRARAESQLPGAIAEIASDVRFQAFGGRREDKTVVRYFRDPDRFPEDQKIARAIVAAMTQKLGFTEIRDSYVIDKDSVGSGPRIQIWLRKEDFSE